jgi:XTP/dITP diphosphohydrolase
MPDDAPAPNLPRLILATHNRGKTAQIAEALAGQYEVADLHHPDLAHLPEIEETGTTFAENAALKALGISRLLPAETWVLADDSGICVDALDGAPGVYSARYSGPGATDASNNVRLQAELEARGALEQSARGAHYICMMVLARGGEATFTAEGRVDGYLLREPRGSGGFGYDPYFVPLALGDGRTFSELSNAEKLPFNHRGKALRAVVEFLGRQPSPAA